MLWPGAAGFGQDDPMRTHFQHRFAHVAATACVTCLICGCGPRPRAVLDDMARAYREATTYADDARVLVRITSDGRSTERTIPLRVAFARPDRIRIEAYDARIVSAEDTLFAAVGGVPGQVLSAPLSGALDLEGLFADDVVRVTLTEGEAGCPVQLPLLLADDTLDHVLGDATAAARIAGHERVEDRPCVRVEIPKPDGPLELWIDRESRVLRRMKIPTASYAAMLSRQSGTPTQVSVLVDFTGAALNGAVPAEAFAFQVPDGAARVERLEPLRPPAPPSPLVGRRPERFLLTDLGGKTLTPDSLQGRPAVLEFFFIGCTPCNRTMPEVARGISRYESQVTSAAAAPPAPRHLAVSVDAADVSSAELHKTLAEFGGVGEIVRDADGLVSRALVEDVFPATVILAADGSVADVIVGEHGQIAADVAESLTALAASHPTAPIVRARQRSRLEEYRRRLAEATGSAATRRQREQVIAPQRQPVRFKLRRIWRSAAVALPGNVICLDEAQGGVAAARVVALDGWRRVVEIDAAGTAVGQHELALPRDAAVSFLRTAVDDAGKRWWLGAAKGGRQVYLFDESWRLATAYPPSGTGHDGISAAALHDLNGDGSPEIVIGFTGAGGLEAVSLGGERLWRNGDLGAVESMAVDGGAGLACIDHSGRIVAVSKAGQVIGAHEVADRRLRTLVSGPVASGGGWAAVASADSGSGKKFAVGIDSAWSEAWALPLADGEHRDGPIEPVAWADLLGTLRRQWLIAATDGSLTVAWANGGVVDRYQHGKALVGIGGYRHDGAGHIVIATRDGLESYRVEDVALD